MPTATRGLRRPARLSGVRGRGGPQNLRQRRSRPERHRAARQTLEPSNTIFANGDKRTTLEWRFERKAAGLVPYAVIMRYFTHDDSGHGQSSS